MLEKNPQLISRGKIESPANGNTGNRNQVQEPTAALLLFVDACKIGKQYPGYFSDAEYLTETINLYAVALRANELLKYDATSRTITNVRDANKYLSRQYRKGWDSDSI